MIKVSVLYPSGDDVTFDHDYYVDKHIPMVADRLGDKLKGGHRRPRPRRPRARRPPLYLAMAHLHFDSVEDFQAAMAPDAEEIAADVANYTNTTATMQVSEVAK